MGNRREVEITDLDAVLILLEGLAEGSWGSGRIFEICENSGIPPEEMAEAVNNLNKAVGTDGEWDAEEF